MKEKGLFYKYTDSLAKHFAVIQAHTDLKTVIQLQRLSTLTGQRLDFTHFEGSFKQPKRERL